MSSLSMIGRVLEIINKKNGTRHQFLIDVKGQNIILGKVDQPYTRINIRQNDEVEFNDEAKFSMFVLEELDNRISAKVIGRKPSYLIINSEGQLEIVSCFDATTDCVIRLLDNNGHRCLSSMSPLLDHQQFYLRRLAVDGFVVLDQIIDKDLITNCQRTLMHNLGVPGKVVAGGAQVGLGKLEGSMSNCIEIRSLITHQLLSVLEEFFGSRQVDLESCNHAQIALRFPQINGTKLTEQELNTVEWHTDGHRQGKYHPFGILMGICLSDCTETFSGNLLIWPGTHLLIHRTTDELSGRINYDLLAKVLENSSNKPIEMELDSLNIGNPIQIKLKAGDIVLMHPDTAHTGGPNYSSTIRSMIYFRVKSLNHAANDKMYRDNMWVDLPHVKEAIAQLLQSLT